MLVSVPDYEQVSVLYARYEAYFVIAEVGIQEFYQCVALFRGEVSAVMVIYPAVGQCYYVAAHGHVVRVHVVTYACRLKRSAPLIHLVKVVAKDGRVGNFAARMETVGYGYEAACAAFARQHVHIWLAGILQESLAAKPSDRVVGS